MGRKVPCARVLKISFSEINEFSNFVIHKIVTKSKIIPSPLQVQLYMNLLENLNNQIQYFNYKRLLNKPYVNEVTLKGHNLSLKCCQPLELLTCLKRGLSSFHTVKIEFVGQRAASLLSVK